MPSLFPLDEPPPKRPPLLTVSQLTQLIQGTLESTFHSLWVGGEVSQVSQHQSGHIYFTLKDERAKISAVIWRSTAATLRFRLAEGQHVICQGGLSVYPPRGNYQLSVRQIEPQGLGALQLAFRQLQERLAAEGLFDAHHKRPLPSFPRRVGFVTSPTGAAIHDFLQVAARRFAGVQIIVIPARVQGEGAATDIARAIAAANRVRPALDVLVVGRGGGSLEDLWCFNEEPVVRAIFASEIPVVSAVGHEIDVTLADLVADVRALTPSEAAELVIPSADELSARLAQHQRRMLATLRARVASARRHVEQLARSRILRQPLVLVRDLSRRLDELDSQAARAIHRQIAAASEKLSSTTARLESLSPLAVLARGYTITTREHDAAIVRSASDVAIGERVVTQLLHGQIVSVISEREDLSVES